MAARIDHLVWYGSDLRANADFFAARLEQAPVYGGVHPGEGTGNFLLSLGETTYLEILGRDPQQPENSVDAEIRALEGTGLYHWAAAVGDLAALRDSALAAGLDGSDLVKGGRELPGGGRLQWQCFGIRGHGLGALVPFFIDWMDTPHPARTAPQGGKLADFLVTTPEAAKLRGIYRVLGVDIPVAEGPAAGIVATVEARGGLHALPMFDPPPRGYVI